MADSPANLAAWPEAAARATLGRRGVTLHYGDPPAEFRAVEGPGGICDRSDRAVLRVIGRDRAAWLHNLTTNQVKTLQPGEWRYAFVLNVKGRILFDLNLLVDKECIWLDLDDRFMPAALAHFDKYTISEDVKVEDVSDRFARYTVLGSNGVRSMNEWLGPPASEPLGLPRRSTEPAIASTSVVPERTATPHESWTPRSFQNDVVMAWPNPSFGVESTDLIIPREVAGSLCERLTRPPTPDPQPPLCPVGWSALEARRIEAGIPASVSELNEEALPAETGLLDRAVSFNKGCYLGQEVVERMRAHKSVARKLVGIAFGESFEFQVSSVELPASIAIEGKPAGSLTSFCHSPKLGRTIGLSFIRVANAIPGAAVRVGEFDAAVSVLPFGS